MLNRNSDLDLKSNFSLKKLNTFGLDVASEYFYVVKNLNDLRNILSDPKTQKMLKECSDPRLLLKHMNNPESRQVIQTLQKHGLIRFEKQRKYVNVKIKDRVHMVKDKINFRAKGPRTPLTRQTVQGRANDGGL